MEVTRGWKSKALISSFTSPASSSSAISFYPVFIRRELFGCRPPGLRSRYKCRKLGHKSQIPRCSLRDSIIERYLVAVTATAVALTAIRFVYSYYVDRKSNAASLEVSKSEIQNDTINSEAIKQDDQNVTNEVYLDITEVVNAELLNPQFTSAEEEKKHNTSEIIAISQLPQIREEILVSNLKEDIEMGSLSKGFFPKVALEFTAPHSDGIPIKSEHKKGRVTVACIKQGAPSNVKKLETNGKSTPSNDKVYPNIINGNSTQINGKSTQFPRTNEIKKGSNSTSENLLIYNRLLRDGRLGDCIELLENMEKEEVLDMDKIHHSTFLNKCKNRRSVKEAIRFVKLIKNPRMSTFNMLLSVCASSQDFDGAHQVMRLLKETGLKPDYKLYTTLISAYGKSGKVDAMFQIFHEMVNVGIMPNVNTYGALIDGCARSGQIAKAFGAYGIMRSKKVQPDRVVFNALITTCGESGAVDRAFDVLSEMLGENIPVLPDHVTVGALIKTCTNAGLVDRAQEVYKMLDEYEIVGSVEVYTIAIRSCSFNGDLQFALQIYNDMKNKGVKPDEMFLSTLFDVAGHARDLEVAFKILNEAKNKGIKLGVISYSSLMGACCNAKDWEKSLELYEEIKSRKIMPSVSMMNALITALCEGGQIEKALEIHDEMKKIGAKPNQITYTVLIVACEKKDEAELAFNLFQQAKTIGISINSTICGCLTGLCLQRYQKECSLGIVAINFKSGKPQIANKWTSLAIKAYREMISARMQPKIDSLCQVIGCMKFPADSLSRNKMIESLEIGVDHSDEAPNVSGLMDGFGIYDPRTFNILEEAVALGMVPRLSLNDNPIVIDATKFQIHIAEIYILEILKALKNRLAAGAQLPSLTILVPNEKIQFVLYEQEDRTINLAGRLGQAVGSLLRRLGVRYEGDESHGQFRITGLSLKRWYEPKLDEISFPGNGFQDMIPIPARLSKGIADQQRNIRSGMNLSFDD